MRKEHITIETGRVGNMSTIGCDGTGYGDTFQKLGRCCNQCPIRFKCFTSNGTIRIESQQDYDKVVDFIQGR